MDRFVALKAKQGDVMLVEHTDGEIGLAIVSGDYYIQVDFAVGSHDHANIKALFENTWKRLEKKKK